MKQTKEDQQISEKYELVSEFLFNKFRNTEEPGEDDIEYHTLHIDIENCPYKPEQIAEKLRKAGLKTELASTPNRYSRMPMSPVYFVRLLTVSGTQKQLDEILPQLDNIPGIY
jgi:hypothetical protein